MSLKKTNEPPAVLGAELLLDFQMEELEERMEMKIEWRDPFNGQLETPPTSEVEIVV